MWEKGRCEREKEHSRMAGAYQETSECMSEAKARENKERVDKRNR